MKIASKNSNKAVDKTRFGVKGEQELISSLFSRSFETLRVMSSYNGCLLKDIKKRIMEEFNIGDNMARKHVMSVIKDGFFTKGEDGRVYRNEKKIKWLWSYLLSIFPNIAEEHIAEMFLSETKKLDPKKLEEKIVKSLKPAIRTILTRRTFRSLNKP